MWISSNRGPYSLFFDFTAKNRFSGSTKQNLIETYIDLFSAAFSMNGLREYVYENMTEFYLDLSNEYEGVGTTGSTEMVVEKNDRNSALGTGANAKPILCLVGVKEFRNFSSTLWHRIIVAFAEKYPDREVEVIDSPDNLVRESLEAFTYPKNVIFIENPHPKSLSDFANWASCRYQVAF